ncbi:metabolite traffic protein EboE [Intrasporangium flavum]|uniref:metabolite traffic protein EboE n=1 Tax=Intrasporangium flavum TaxID=1428657 RepID=UPI00096D53B7|nr:metabolite traffic protein EboE [Intrasporangium flavum]
MRLQHADGTTVHVAYCTNVHGGEDIDTIVGQLDRFALPVRQHLGADVLGVGLWLSAPVAHALAAEASLTDRLRTELDRRGLEVVTLNGFPYRGFQEPVVKHRVYHPDWSEPARLRYTTDLADVLARLLPDDAARGSISTLPLGWRHPWFGDRQALAAEQFERLAAHLHALRDRTGRTVRVALEPEPGCVVETVSDLVERTRGWDRDVIGACLDLCHLAVGFEDAGEALAALDASGTGVAKAQVSAGLHAADPTDPATRAALAAFDEERFLHQVRSRDHAGQVRTRDDLGEALGGRRPLCAHADEPWRVHFHVPLGTAPEPPLTATTDDLRRSLDALVGGATARTDHLEVETYTWTVVPERHRPRDDAGLARSIAGELAWLRDTLIDLGLKEPA